MLEMLRHGAKQTKTGDHKDYNMYEQHTLKFYNVAKFSKILPFFEKSLGNGKR